MTWWIPFVAGALDLLGGNSEAKNNEAADARSRETAEFQAQDAGRRGTLDEMRYRRELRQFIGKQRNEIGTRNVSASGSALSLLEDSAGMGEEDLTAIRNNAAREAWGIRSNAGEASRSYSQRAANARSEGFGSLLTSGLQAYGNWKKL